MAVQRIGTGKPLFPSWKQLLEHAAARLQEEGKSKEGAVIQALLESDQPDFLYAAKRAREGLGPVWFQFLKDEIDAGRPQVEEASLGLARGVWSLGSKLVLTTNYDRVLEWASPEETSSWIIQATAEQAHLLQGRLNRRTVWHLHGFIDDVASLILSPNGYDQLYPTNQEPEVAYAAALETLRAQIASKTLLFIGFSLEDERFVNELRRNDEIFGGAGGPHYVLVAESGMERFRSLKLSVEPLTFVSNGQPLLDALHALADVAVPTSDSVAPLIATERSLAGARDFNPDRRVFSVPFRPKGDQVIGRNAALEAVRKQLVSGRRTAIGQTAAFQGLGGLGKTQLAVEYAYRYADEYPNGVIWLNADQDLSSQLTDLAERAGWVAPEAEATHKLGVATNRLKTYSDCLLIFDNLDELKTLEAYLPDPAAHPHILITSRADQPGFARIPLDPLTDQLSLDLLLQEAGKRPKDEAEWKEAREIATILGGLPLALELAGAFLQHREVSWSRYNTLLKVNLKAALPGGRLLAGSFTKHEADLYSTLKIEEEIYRDEPRLRDILDLLTWSGPAPMSESLMTTLLEVDSSELTEALGLGVTLRLLHRKPETANYLIHRLVREVRREEIPLHTRREWTLAICQRVARWFGEQRRDFSNLAAFEAEIDHLYAWRINASSVSQELETWLTWLQAYPPFYLAQYHQSKEWIDAALNIYEQSELTDIELKSNLLHDLGVLLRILGDSTAGLQYGLEALQLRLDVWGESNRDVAQSLSAVGTAYDVSGNTKEALKYQLKALEIRKAVLGEQHEETARSFAAVGLTYGNLRDYRKALEYHEEGLKIRQQVLGEEHPNTANSLCDIGLALFYVGERERSLQYVTKSLRLLQDVFGDFHPHVGDAYDALADIKWGLGDREEAINCRRKSLAIRRHLFGDSHPDTVGTALALAILLSNAGLREEALKLTDEFRGMLNKNHPITQRFIRLREGLASKAIRPGFRQPSMEHPQRNHQSGKKTKKKKRKN